MPTTTQDDRLLAIFTPLGKDFLLLNQFTASEGISQLFSIEAELLHEEDESKFEPTVIDPKSLIGQGVTITVTAPDGSGRDFSGIGRNPEMLGLQQDDVFQFRFAGQGCPFADSSIGGALQGHGHFGEELHHRGCRALLRLRLAQPP